MGHFGRSHFSLIAPGDCPKNSDSGFSEFLSKPFSIESCLPFSLPSRVRCLPFQIGPTNIRNCMTKNLTVAPTGFFSFRRILRCTEKGFPTFRSDFEARCFLVLKFSRNTLLRDIPGSFPDFLVAGSQVFRRSPFREGPASSSQMNFVHF